MEMDLSLLQGEFDVIILGTGLIECTLSGVLSKDGLRVLVLDKNDYYGGGCASLSLPQLYTKVKNEQLDNEQLVRKFGGPAGASNLEQRRWLNEWNLDLIPKFIMGSGLLSRILVHTGVTRYLQFQKAAGSFVYKEGKIHKVPSTASEALNSSLMGFFEKRKCHKLLQYIEGYKADDPKTHQGINGQKTPFKAVYDKFGVDENTRSFVGHAVGLYTDDSYVDLPAQQVIEQIMLYRNSFFSLGGGSPYIYPRHGLSELPQAFARQGAVYGATTMLRAPLEEILFDNGVATGIKLRVNENEVIDVKTKFLIGDPSYFPDRVKVVGKVLRMICILNHPIPNTGNAHSAQIIVPQKESGRSHDIHILCLSSTHCVVPEGKYLAIVTTELNEAESKMEPQKVLGGACRLLGEIVETFVMSNDIYEPSTDGTQEKCFVSKSYDGTGHFQSAAVNILSIYKRLTGKDLVLTTPEPEDGDE